VQLTIDELNASRWSPWKDYERERLIDGRLQLPFGTQLIVDETALQTGQLNENGTHCWFSPMIYPH
jgi:hypothetical protein